MVICKLHACHWKNTTRYLFVQLIGLLDYWIIGEGVVSESQNEVETNERNRRNCYQAEENVLEALKRPNANETNSQINQNIFFSVLSCAKNEFMPLKWILFYFKLTSNGKRANEGCLHYFHCMLFWLLQYTTITFILSTKLCSIDFDWFHESSSFVTLSLSSNQFDLIFIYKYI